MSIINKPDITLPIYLNEKIVVDMLAMIEDGFSMVSSISAITSDNTSSNNKLGFDADVNGIMSRLLKISFATGHTGSESKSFESTTTSEKVHTISSLFFKLRNYLHDNNLIVDLTNKLSVDQVTPGDFIEAQGSLEKNPLIHMLEDMSEALKFADMFSDEAQLGNKSKSSKSRSDSNKAVKQIDNFVEKLKVSGTEDFIMKGDVSVVLSVQEKYLSNDNVSEMVGGEFRVIGKVIQIYRDESVNLLRKTPLALLSDKDINEFKNSFDNEDLQEYKLPELTTEVEAPSIVIIPVAIFI